MQKPYVLAVETSAPIGSVAIALGEQILAETTFSGPMRHSSEIFPAIDGLLGRLGRGPKEIKQVYISVGPGSFTGLRIAVTIAKTMYLANAAKIVAVDTLDVIAANAVHYTKEKNIKFRKIAVILDAKRGQFFIAVYQRNPSGERRATSDGIWKKILPDSLMTASQFLEKFAGQAEPVWLLGMGLVHHKDKFKVDGICFFEEKYWTPRAEKVHLLGWKMAQAGNFADALTLQPNYLRVPDIRQKKG